MFNCPRVEIIIMIFAQEITLHFRLSGRAVDAWWRGLGRNAGEILLQSK